MTEWDVGDDVQKQQMAIRHYCNHLVSLSLCITDPDKSGNLVKRPFAFSGFVMSVRGHWNLVTAGHIVRELDTALSNPKAALTSCVLRDEWGSNSKFKGPVFPPFDYQGAPKVALYDKELGIDFALIGLSPFYQEQLQRNNIRAISEQNWVFQGNVKFSEYFVLGLPTEMTIRNEDIFIPVPVIVPLTKIDPIPENYKKPFPQFVGKIFENVTLTDMDGMSGGPIIGIGDGGDGKRRYWIVAVQSSWFSRERVILGCPVPIFAGMIERLVQEIVESEDE